MRTATHRPNAPERIAKVPRNPIIPLPELPGGIPLPEEPAVEPTPEPAEPGVPDDAPAEPVPLAPAAP